jgi:hypothetical protein
MLREYRSSYVARKYIIFLRLSDTTEKYTVEYSYSPSTRRKSLQGGWRLWCGAEGMFTTRWIRGLLLVTRDATESCTTTHKLKISSN